MPDTYLQLLLTLAASLLFLFYFIFSFLIIKTVLFFSSPPLFLKKILRYTSSRQSPHTLTLTPSGKVRSGRLGRYIYTSIPPTKKKGKERKKEREGLKRKYILREERSPLTHYSPLLYTN